MKIVYKSVAVLALVALVAPLTQAAEDETPNINKRGENEKAFVEKLTVAIVRAARTSIKTATLEKFEKKTPKEGRLEFHIKADWKGAVLGKHQTSDIVVIVDNSDKNAWEVLRIEYSDDEKSLVPFNRKNISEMVKKLNAK